MRSVDTSKEEFRPDPLDTIASNIRLSKDGTGRLRKDPRGDELLELGPFKLDYQQKTARLEDWNLHVTSPQNKPHQGNVVVGVGHFYNGASNSVAFGKHNRVTGVSVGVFGGMHNQAQ